MGVARWWSPYWQNQHGGIHKGRSKMAVMNTQVLMMSSLERYVVAMVKLPPPPPPPHYIDRLRVRDFILALTFVEYTRHHGPSTACSSEILCRTSQAAHPEGGQDPLFRLPGGSSVADSTQRLPHDGGRGACQTLLAGGRRSTRWEESAATFPPLFLVFEVPTPSGLHLRVRLDQPAVGRWRVVWSRSTHHSEDQVIKTKTHTLTPRPF